MKDDPDLDGVLSTDFLSFFLVLLRLVDGTLNGYSIYSLTDALFDSFSRDSLRTHRASAAAARV
jgi:hypothetical protein